MRRIFHLTGLFCLALQVWAGEYAVLSSGFRLHTDRHEVSGATVRLFTSGGVTEMPASAIVRFEMEEYIPTALQPPAAPQPDRAEPAAIPSTPATPKEMAFDAARRYSLPPGIVTGVMKAESGFHSAAVSPKGALGLMQLMPKTARELGVNPFDPKENTTGGARYLHDLLVKYENDPDQVLLALAAYNAGPGAVEKYHGVPPYRETREYILRVLKNWRLQEPAAR